MNDTVLTNDAYKRFGLTEELVTELQGLINAVMFDKELSAVIVVELACDGLDFSKFSPENVKQFSNGEKVFIRDCSDEFVREYTDPVAFKMIQDAASAGHPTAVLFRGRDFMLLPLGFQRVPFRVTG